MKLLKEWAWPSVAAIVPLALFAWSWHLPAEESDSLASWAQAFGSVAAIFGAYGIGRQQMLLDQKLAKEAAAAASDRLLSVVRAVVNDVFQQILDVEEVFADTDSTTVNSLVYPAFFSLAMQYDAASYGASVRRLEAIPVFELGSETVATNVISLQEAASSLIQWFETASRMVLGPTRKDDQAISDDQLATVIRSYIADARRAYQAIISEIGGTAVAKGRPFRGKL